MGKEVVKRLQREAFDLYGLARSENSKVKLLAVGVKPVLGSMENVSEWKQELMAMDVIIHCAAPVEFWGAWQKYQKGIIDATANLYQAGEELNVGQFIYISSESVLQSKGDLIDIDETTAYPVEPNSYYGKSKMMAEQFILGQKGQMKSIILRPTFIWGKGVKALSTILGKIKSNDFMWIDHGKSWFEMVHVKNVAEAICLAVLNGESKDKAIYYVTDDNPQTTSSFLTKLIKTQGVTPLKKSIPKGLANALAPVVEWVWNTFKLKSDPMITRFDMAFVVMGRKYNITKIKSELGYKPVVSESNGLAEMEA